MDIEFPAGQLPAIFNAVVLERQRRDLTCEVQQHLGNNWVRAVAMTTTDGLARGTEAVDTGAPISVPVGPTTLGRVFNVLGEPIDGKGPVESDVHYPIHRDAPSFEDQTTATEVFETGIKVIDLIAPSPRAARSASSVAPAWARRSSSRSSSATSPRSTVATPCSRASASAPARATTCSTR